MILRTYKDFKRLRDIPEGKQAFKDEMVRILNEWDIHTNNVQIRDDDREADRVCVNFQCVNHWDGKWVVLWTQCLCAHRLLVSVVVCSPDGWDVIFNREIPSWTN